jgi:hypothetical protein
MMIGLFSETRLQTYGNRSFIPRSARSPQMTIEKPPSQAICRI